MNRPLTEAKAQVRSAWKGLAPRERHAVAGTGLLLVALFVWMGLVQPPLKAIDYWQSETPKLRSQAQALADLLPPLNSADDRQSLPQRLQQSLDSSGLQGSVKLSSIDPHTWQLNFDQAPAAAVMGWLLRQPARFSLEVVEARLQRTGAAQPDHSAGTVSGTVRMNQALGAKEAS